MPKLNYAQEKETGKDINRLVEEFEKDLRKTGFQHVSTEEFAKIVSHYAKTLINMYFKKEEN